MISRRELLKTMSLAALGSQLAVAAGPSPVEFVNPFIGTGAHGHTFPGATVPFGLVQLSPDNGVAGWDWCSGYHYSSDVIKCFSHTHLSGTGIGDMYDIGLMPIMAAPGRSLSDWRAKFSHAQEEASPGYYAVKLPDAGIRVELTATERVGAHRYAFPAPTPKQQPAVVFDLRHSLNWDTPTNTLIQALGNRKIVGYRYSKGWAREQKIYFEARFSKPFTIEVVGPDGSLQPAQSIQAPGAQALLTFAGLNEPLVIYVALSPVSAENAAANLEREIGASGFDAVKAKARAAWETHLARLSVETNDTNAKTVFYTALYHAMLAPTLFCDADGSYRGPDSKIHNPLETSKTEAQSPKTVFQNYSTYSLWDTFRAAHPLYTLVQPERVNDLVQSMMAFYREHGTLPVWSLAGNETGTMIGYHSVPVIVDAYFKGLAKIDPQEALAAMKQSAFQRRLGLQYYQTPEPTTLEELQKSAAREELPRVATLDEKVLANYGPLVAGYAKSVSGPNIHYHSAYPHVKDALIARCEAGKDVIEWETAIPPEGGTTNAPVTFAWLAGIDVDGDGHRYDFHVNGDKWLSFNNPKTTPPHSFSARAANGATLDFHATHTDQFGDLFGYMFLTVPRKLLTPGQPLRLKVVGERADADDWYMTFKHEFKHGFNLSNVFALINADGQLKQALRADFENFGLPRQHSLDVSQAGKITIDLAFGAKTVFLPVPAVKEATNVGVFYTHEPVRQPDSLATRHIAYISNSHFFIRPAHPFNYIPCELEGESVSKTLEYAYDDWCIAEFARKIGARADAAVFDKRAQYYRNLFDKQTGFMRGKTSEGAWAEPFTPGFSDKQQHHYTEGNAWQYTWSVMHDVPGLIALLGGPEKFVAKLDELFDQKVDYKGKNVPPDVSGLIGEYAHGNEPSHHIAYLYALAGYAWKTQERVRQITRAMYHNTPEGLCGNEDCGQMSAWYIFSALGFYPVNPANGEYVLGAPHFPAATLQLPGGKQFRILAPNVSDKNFYVAAVKLNGQPLRRHFIRHAEIVAGGTLEFTMSDKPRKI
jgi:putative alpha-1,2-mannosidase